MLGHGRDHHGPTGALLALLLGLGLAPGARAVDPASPEAVFATWPAEISAPIPASCATPPCGATRRVSGGDGGYLAVTPARLLPPPGRAASATLAPGPVTRIRVAGRDPLPPRGVGAVVLRLRATGIGGQGALVAWPAGTRRPATTSLSVGAGRPAVGLTVVAPGRGGAVSLALTRAAGQPRARVAVDVVGWFPTGDGMVAVPPRRILDTRTGVGVPAARMRSGALLPVRRAGLPRQGAAAAVMSLTLSGAARPTTLTLWPAGRARPATVNLSASPGAARTTLAVVGVGTRGRVSLALRGGPAHVSADLLGWLRTDGTYTAIPGQRLVRAARPGTLDLRVASDPAGGRPPKAGTREEAKVAVLTVTASGGVGATEVRVWPTGDRPPRGPSLVRSGRGPATGLVFAPLGADGRTSIGVTGRGARVNVDLVGWFTPPASSTQLVVTEGTSIPDTTRVSAVSGDSSSGATITLAPGTAAVRSGQPLVLGVTDGAPEGILGRVTRVVARPDGSQVVTTEPAALEEVFPEGEISLGPSPGAVAQKSVHIRGTRAGFEVTSDDSPLRIAVEANAANPDRAKGCAPTHGVFRLDWSPILSVREFGVRWRGWKTPKVTLVVRVGSRAAITLAELSARCHVSIGLKRGIKNFQAGPVPVIVTFDLTLDFELNAGLSASVLKPSAEAFVDIGVRQNEPVFEAEWNAQVPDLRRDDLFSVAEARAWGMLDVWLSEAVKLYGVIGPRISSGPFVEALVTTDREKPWFSLDIGWASRISLVIDLWFKRWTPVSWAGEMPFAWMAPPCGQYGPGWDGRFCRSDTPKERADGSAGLRLFQPRFRPVSSGEALPSLQIAAGDLPRGKVGQAYRAQLRTAESWLFKVGSATWSLVSGSLPPGLSLDAGSGAISGTPTRAGELTFTVEARHPLSPPAGQTLTIGVDPTLRIVGPEPPVWRVSKDDTVRLTLQAEGQAPFTWRVEPGAPPGLAIQPEGALLVLAGAPTTVGTYPLQVTVTDGTNASAATTVSIEVVPEAPRPKIAFTSDRDGGEQIYVMDTDGTDQQRLTPTASTNMLPDWSPDGGRIAFTSDEHGRREIHVMDPDGTDVVRLTTAVEYEEHIEPAWSPDGARIAFTRREDEEGTSAIWVTDAAAGQEPDFVVGYDASHSSWAPDGHRVAYARQESGQAADIWVTDVDQGGQDRLTTSPASDTHPDWSPDGSRIAFLSDRDGNTEIYVMDADGTDQTRLTTHPSRDWHPEWSPDGSRIAFMSDRDGNAEIYVMNADGANQTRLTSNAAEDTWPAWQPRLPVSPP